MKEIKENISGKMEFHDGINWQTIASENWTASTVVQQLKEVQDGRLFDILLLVDEVF